MPRCHISYLGVVEVRNAAGERVRFRTRATETLALYLGFQLGDWRSRDQLIDIGWPGAPPESGRRSLRTALSSLRSTLGADVVETSKDRVRLSPELVTRDFESFLESGRPADFQGLMFGGDVPDWAASMSFDLNDRYVAAVLEAIKGRGVAESATTLRAALDLFPDRLELRSAMRELSVLPRPVALPTVTTSFLGRQREIETLEALLMENRLVTLTAPGGYGKTRVAAELWRRHQPNSWFVSLSDVEDPAQVAEEIRRRLQLAASPGRAALDQVAHAIGEDAGVLILDNFEHVVGARDVAWSIVAACPNLNVVVTSQVVLGLESEVEFPLGPLSLEPGPDQEPSDGQRLFVDRARTADPTFEVTTDNQEAIVRLCERLDGYPLALELAAAKARLFSPAEMLEQLKDRFSFLSRGEGRRRSLHAALDWSFDRLPTSAQNLLLDLTIFSDPFALEAIDQVCSPTEGHSSVELLVAHGWLAAGPSTIPRRFRLIESVREYGQELLPPRRRDELCQRLAERVLTLGARCLAATFGPNEAAIHDEVELEIHNIETAWEWLIDRDPEEALRLVTGFNWYWVIRGPLRLGQARTKEAIRKTGGKARPVLVHAHQCAGNYALFQGHLEEAGPEFLVALDMAVEIGHVLHTGHALIQSAQVHAEQGNYALAKQEVDQGIACCQLDGNDNWIGAAYVIACLVANRAGDTATAIGMGQAAVRACRSGGYPWGIASALNELAMAHHLMGNYRESIRIEHQAIELKLQTQAVRSLALSYADLAASHLALGEASSARAYLRLAADMLVSAGLPGAFPRLYLTASRLLERTDPALSDLCLAAVLLLIGPAVPTHAHLRLTPGEASCWRNMDPLPIAELETILRRLQTL